MAKRNKQARILSLISEICERAQGLQRLFWSQDELRERQYAADFLEARIQQMIRATQGNLSWYQHEGWKTFLDEEDEGEAWKGLKN